MSPAACRVVEHDVDAVAGQLMLPRPSGLSVDLLLRVVAVARADHDRWLRRKTDVLRGAAACCRVSKTHLVGYDR